MAGPIDGPVFCDDCEYVFRVNRGDPPWRWLCVRHKRLDVAGFVARDELAHAPYAPCYRVNYGLCPLYERARTVENAPTINDNGSEPI
jgi:hypothetical protein